MEDTAKQRLLLFIRELGVGQTKFEAMAGLSNGYVSKLKSSPTTEIVKRIVGRFPQLNSVWLLTGEGEMLTGQQGAASQEREEGDYRMVPVVHIDSVGGIHSPNDMLAPEYVERYIPMTDARDGDVVIYQSGNSMAPAIPSGSMLLIREVAGWREYIGYGDVFVLLLQDGRRITKELRRYVQDPHNYYWCVSYNPDVEDEELPRSLVSRVWKVIKVLIDKGW